MQEQMIDYLVVLLPFALFLFLTFWIILGKSFRQVIFRPKLELLSLKLKTLEGRKMLRAEVGNTSKHTAYTVRAKFRMFDNKNRVVDEVTSYLEYLEPSGVWLIKRTWIADSTVRVELTGLNVGII